MLVKIREMHSEFFRVLMVKTSSISSQKHFQFSGQFWFPPLSPGFTPPISLYEKNVLKLEKIDFEMQRRWFLFKMVFAYRP